MIPLLIFDLALFRSFGIHCRYAIERSDIENILDITCAGSGEVSHSDLGKSRIFVGSRVDRRGLEEVMDGLIGDMILLPLIPASILF